MKIDIDEILSGKIPPIEDDKYNVSIMGVELNVSPMALDLYSPNFVDGYMPSILNHYLGMNSQEIEIHLTFTCTEKPEVKSVKTMPKSKKKKK